MGIRVKVDGIRTCGMQTGKVSKKEDIRIEATRVLSDSHRLPLLGKDWLHSFFARSWLATNFGHIPAHSRPSVCQSESSTLLTVISISFTL